MKKTIKFNHESDNVVTALGINFEKYEDFFPEKLGSLLNKYKLKDSERLEELIEMAAEFTQTEGFITDRDVLIALICFKMGIALEKKKVVMEGLARDLRSFMDEEIKDDEDN